MSDDFKLPDLPSDEELGIDDEDLKEYIEDEGSELSAAEMEALLGGTQPQAPPPEKAPDSRAEKKARKKAEREAKKAAKAAEKAAKEQAKAKAAAGAPEGDGTPPGAEPPAGEPPSGPPPGEKSKAVGPEPEGPRTAWRGPLTLAVLLLAAWLGSSGQAVPDPVPANAPDTVFSSARAMAHVVEIARTAHPPGSPEHDRVRAYILDELSDLGLEPTVQTVTSWVVRGSVLQAVTARNVLARIPGTASTGAVLVTAHYDGRGLARAAGDDGSGVVSILESLRALRASPPLRNDLIVLITDAEELGLLGARGFVNEHPWMEDVQAVISLEMRGSAGPSIMFETGPAGGWILRAFQEGAPRPFANSVTYEVYRRLPNDTDFTPFREAGKQGLNFAAIGNAPVYHQVFDSPENLSEGTLQHHGLNGLSMIRTLGSTDLTEVNAPDVVYFTVPGLGLVIYPEGWIWPITAVVVTMWLLVLLLARAKGVGLAAPVVGLLIALSTMGVSYAAGHWGRPWLTRFHPEAGSLHGGLFYGEGWYILALAALAFAVLTGLWGLARSRFSFRGLALGASLPAVVAVAGITWILPLGAMNLQWPALALVTGMAAAVLLPATGRLRDLRWLIAVAGAVVVALILTSMTELLWLAMSIRMASEIGLLLVLILLFMLPALDALREPNAWFAPVLATVAAVGLLALGILQAGPSADRPLPSTLVYALDVDNGEALWATNRAGQETAARTWAEETTTASFDSILSLARRGGPRFAYAVAPAPVVAPPPPTVTLVEDAVQGSVRRLRIAVRSTLGAELLRFDFTGADVQLVGLNGKEVTQDIRAEAGEDGRPLRVDHWGRPDSAVVLDLSLPARDSLLTFTLSEHTLRPGELLGADFFQRPPELVPDIVQQSDRAILTRSVVLELEAAAGAGGSSTDAEGAGAPAAADSMTVPDTTTAADSAAAPDTSALPDTSSVPDPTGSANRPSPPGGPGAPPAGAL